jgi:hypothetical protein
VNSGTAALRTVMARTQQIVSIRPLCGILTPLDS